MNRCQTLSEPAAQLAMALHRGELDDPFAGWEILTRYASEIGPRYVEMVAAHPDPGQSQAPPTSNVHTLLPRMTLNGAFVGELIAAEPPAFALGLVLSPTLFRVSPPCLHRIR